MMSFYFKRVCMYVRLSVFMSLVHLYFCLSGQSGLFLYHFLKFLFYIFHCISTLFSPFTFTTNADVHCFLVGQCMQDHGLSFHLVTDFFPQISNSKP